MSQKRGEDWKSIHQNSSAKLRIEKIHLSKLQGRADDNMINPWHTCR